MAARTSPDEVQGILGANYDTINSPDLAPFIRTANVITNRVSSLATAKGVTLDSATLLEIETYLAAHFYTHSDPLFQSKSTSEASANFQVKVGDNFNSTVYGQTAVAMDYSGCLGALSQGALVSMTWLGKPVSTQIDYEDRD